MLSWRGLTSQTGPANRREIGGHNRADARRLRARAEEGHGFRSQQLVEIADGHEKISPRAVVRRSLTGPGGDLMRQDALAFLSQKYARHSQLLTRISNAGDEDIGSIIGVLTQLSVEARLALAIARRR